MRLGTIGQRAVVFTDDGAVDVHQASGGKFGPSMTDVLQEWRSFRDWCDDQSTSWTVEHIASCDVVGPPIPNARQIFAVGLNYVDHAAESGFSPPESPLVFAKFPSALCGPDATVVLPVGHVDWEVELVVAIGRGGRDIAVGDALDHVAGVMIGQDLSERVGQMNGNPPQFSMAKSYPNFAPTGPALVTLDELPSLDALRLECHLNGEIVQSASTAGMVFSVPELVAHISAITTLLPGDLIFTGTPAGVGLGRTPARFLADGDTLVSSIEHVGTITQTFVNRAP